MMNPRNQECVGHYLYGSGFFARDENTLGFIRGEPASRHFCMSCPALGACEKRQRARVRAQRPEAVEHLERHVREAARRGVSALLVEVMLAQSGHNPYYADAIENFKRGHADRGRAAGTLTEKREATLGGPPTAQGSKRPRSLGERGRPVQREE